LRGGCSDCKTHRVSSPRFTLKVFLYQITPQIWRQFSVPASFTFAQLSHAIQDAMGWQDYHMHSPSARCCIMDPRI